MPTIPTNGMARCVIVMEDLHLWHRCLQISPRMSVQKLSSLSTSKLVSGSRCIEHVCVSKTSVCVLQVWLSSWQSMGALLLQTSDENSDEKRSVGVSPTIQAKVSRAIATNLANSTALQVSFPMPEHVPKPVGRLSSPVHSTAAGPVGRRLSFTEGLPREYSTGPAASDPYPPQPFSPRALSSFLQTPSCQALAAAAAAAATCSTQAPSEAEAAAAAAAAATLDMWLASQPAAAAASSTPGTDPIAPAAAASPNPQTAHRAPAAADSTRQTPPAATEESHALARPPLSRTFRRAELHTARPTAAERARSKLAAVPPAPGSTFPDFVRRHLEATEDPKTTAAAQPSTILTPQVTYKANS